MSDAVSANIKEVTADNRSSSLHVCENAVGEGVNELTITLD